MSAVKSTSASGVVSTRIPARLERLPRGRFHVLVIAASGITWILDGLEVTLAGSVAAASKESPALRFSDPEVGFAGSPNLSGAVLGALFFGWLTDRLGRKKLFFITIAVYLTATALTGLVWSGFSFFLFRFLTGCGIGGECAAINSAVQELIPACYRGHIDLMINGSFSVGAALSALVAVALLNPALIYPEFGWRLAFLTVAALGVVVVLMCMWIPESPRWLAIHALRCSRREQLCRRVRHPAGPADEIVQSRNASRPPGANRRFSLDDAAGSRTIMLSSPADADDRTD
jgi:MFS family permease